ncbi:MAG: UDP-N-acetylmuramoyl-L-alanine--D-glutamate ligase [Phycisphaerae bacterium]|jgi:UDP-N-acetylmuramoylalanine--D-glutamate ligase|nr:UDP-N-acetylmuramoyl-L-alanine--D-glutamate ligase [Phycisphaerae bacterium]
MIDFAGSRVTVVGLGRFGGGIGVTKWLCSQGAIVTVSDRADADALAGSIAQLDGLDVTLHLGSHDLDDFLNADLLVVSPAIPPDIAPLQAAADAGVPRTSEMNLFIERCGAPIIGITGSVGKSTTTAMIGEILSRKYEVHVGGNIGKSLLGQLDDIRPDHLVVLELSSFQLEQIESLGVSPQVSMVTNLTPNHLDRHGTMDAYGRAKQNIFRFQKPSDLLILNSDDPETQGWAELAPGRVEFFDPCAEAFELQVTGQHNQYNAQAAWAVAREFGIDRTTAADVLGQFESLSHRLQLAVERDGVKFYNDSKCTTPGGLIVALDAFDPRTVIVIAGGSDKDVSFDKMGAAIARRAKAIVVMGTTAEKIAASVENARCDSQPEVHRAADLKTAVQTASGLAAPGDVVLLSPACASYDMFTNYQQRGDQFVELASALAEGDK